MVQNWECKYLENTIFKGDAVSAEEKDRHVGWQSHCFPLLFSQFEKGFSVVTRVFLEWLSVKSQKESGDVFSHACTDTIIAVTMTAKGWDHSCPVRLCGTQACGTGRSSAVGPWWWCKVVVWNRLIWGGRMVSVIPSWLLRKVSTVSLLGIVYWVWYGKYLY